MKVLFQYQGLISDEYKKFFRNKVPDEIELIFSDKSNPDELAEIISDIEVFVGYRLSEKLLQNAKSLKHIQIPWTGFNNLGVEKLEKNITISNSHSNSLAIAEHAVALLMSVAKLITFRHNKMLKGDWSPRREEINSFWVEGKTVGILGYGAIGQKVAKMLKFGFNCKILAMRRNKDSYSDEDRKFLNFEGDQNDKEKIIREADYIIVGVPLTTETENMIDSTDFEIMKKTAIIVNIARGPVISEEALYTALKENKIGGAGIDSWYNYPSGGNDKENFQNYPFEELENIVMSPHSAFKVRERVEVFSEHILENILHIFNEQKPINQVNLELGY